MAKNSYKLTLSTDKVVVLSEITIALKNQAVEAASLKSSGGKAFDALLQDEILRQTLVSVDGVKPSGAERENLDNYLSFPEYNEVMAGMTEAMGLSSIKKPKIELITGSV